MNGIGRTDDFENISNARGGVAIFYRKELAQYIKKLDTNLDWLTGIEIAINGHKFIVITIYMPYQCEENKETYKQYLGALDALLDELETTSVVILGDWNANLQNGGRSLFGKHMLEFCADNNLIIADRELLPGESYTHVSESWGTCSWIDHVVCTADFKKAIASINIEYDVTEGDHIPLTTKLDIASIPSVTNEVNECSARINWSSLSQTDLEQYCNLTDEKLTNIKPLAEPFACSDLLCKNEAHVTHLENIYNEIVESLVTSGNIASRRGPKNYVHRPGWSEYVSELYDTSHETRKLWLNHGKPRQGPIYELHNKSRLRVKYAIRFIKRHETQLRRESLAKKLTDCNSYQFWKEINSINSSNMPLPTAINGVTGAENILNLWKKHFFDLFNCIRGTSYNKNNLLLHTTYSEIKVTVEEIRKAICKLENNKTCGLDSIYAESLKYSSDKILPLLSLCLTGFFVHGFLPSSLLSVVLVPIIKDKAGNISSKDNYRPIALASIMSKIVEIVIMNRIEACLYTSSNQFGFKANHGTDQCIYVFKEIIDMYKRLNSRVTVCFLDASKAFDRINHNILFQKLEKRGVCGYLLRIIVFWYETQTMCVRWGSLISESFCVSNGVRQGGILSPYLFNIYMDDLSEKLNKCKVGCYVNSMLINHIMYADDIVLISPSTAGLQKLLDICSEFGISHDVKFNSKKSAIMSFESNSIQKINLPIFEMNGEEVKCVSEYCYLGHIIQKDLSDELDIERQRKKLYKQGNSIIRKFYMCNESVKITLFRSYCTSLYTAQLWCNYKSPTNNRGAMAKLYTAYHSVLKLFMGLSKYDRNSPLCVYTNVPNCPALIRKIVYRFKCRIEMSDNAMISALQTSGTSYSSSLHRKWRELLYVNNS